MNDSKVKSFLIPNKNQFDIHFYFTEETSESALQIRKKLSEKFAFLTFYDPWYKPVGPHKQPMWEADFSKTLNLNEDLGSVIIWLMENRGSHSILIHPHTGNSLADHTIHPIWLGDKLELNLSGL